MSSDNLLREMMTHLLWPICLWLPLLSSLLSFVRGASFLNPENNYGCVSITHPNPVVLLHGLGATYYEDIAGLEQWLKLKGFCTFSLTYGAYPGIPLAGGLIDIASSAHEIALFIAQVKEETGATRIDLVGHSEGGFQALYVPKFEQSVTSTIKRIIAIAPPTHGTTFGGSLDALSFLGNTTAEAVRAIINDLGCPACIEVLRNGTAVRALDQGPIAQSGNNITVITSRYDELVTPQETAFINEPGVRNEWVQDACPDDPVGHINEAVDLNVWNLVLNALEDQPGRGFSCVVGIPG